jgi:antirestriction protein ArdC
MHRKISAVVALFHITGTSRLLAVMKAEPRAIFAAAAKAQEAVTYLDGLQSATAHSFAA